MTKKNMKVVVFDLDDTLYLEKDYIKSGFKHISKVIEEICNKSYKEIYKILLSLFEKSSSKVFNRFFDKEGIVYSESDIWFLLNEYRNHKPLISFCDDVMETVNYLKINGYKTGIITDGFKQSQRNKLNALNAYEIFDEIIVTDELGRDYWKPHPKSFEIIIAKFNVEPNQIIYIGDNPSKDFYIKKYLPIKTCRVNRKGIHSKNEYLENFKEDFTVENLHNITKLF